MIDNRGGRRRLETTDMKANKWKAEVIADNSGEWCGNGLRFDTKSEAETYAMDLAMRWTAVRDWRAVEVEGGAI